MSFYIRHKLCINSYGLLASCCFTYKDINANNIPTDFNIILQQSLRKFRTDKKYSINLPQESLKLKHSSSDTIERIIKKFKEKAMFKEHIDNNMNKEGKGANLPASRKYCVVLVTDGQTGFNVHMVKSKHPRC